MIFLAGVHAGKAQSGGEPAAAVITRPALDAEIAKLSESLYVARQIDAAEVAAARDYLSLSIDLDILALGELVDRLPPQQSAALQAVLADIHEYREGQAYLAPEPREQLSNADATMAAMRRDVEAVLSRAAAEAPRGGLEF